MARPIGPECSFLIPLRRDKELADGEEHDPEAWRWLLDELVSRFSGGRRGNHTESGFYTDPDTGEIVWDESYEFTIAAPAKEVPRLRRLLVEACSVFAQKCIYLEVAGIAELVSGPKHGKH